MKIIFTDIDNTLYKHGENIIHQKTKNAVAFAQSQGVEVVIATGNAYLPNENVDNVAKELNIRYVITSNGATIWDNQEKKFILSQKIPAKVGNEILQFLNENNLMANFWDEEWIYSNTKGMEDNTAEKAILTPNSKVKEKNIVDTDIYKIESYSPDGNMDTFINFIKDFRGYEVAIMKKNVEVTHKGVSKGAAVKWMMDKLGVSKEETVALGDSGNDLTMFAATKESYAMGNSMPEVIEASTGIKVSDARDGGAGEAIMHWLSTQGITK